jgi:hypothetical protein
MIRTIKFTKSELKRLYEKEKLPISKIAKIFNCSYWTVWQTMKKLSIKTRSLSEANKLNNLSRKINIPKKTLENLYVKQRLPTTKIANMFKCRHSTVLKRMKEHGIKARSKSEAMIIYPKKDFSGDFIEKAYLIGFRVGDLFVQRINKKGQTIKVECSTTRPEQVQLIEKLFSKYGHVKKSIFRGYRGKNEIRICCYLNNSFSFLLCKKDKIKNWILKKDKYFFAFLAGYIDAEGHIGVHKYGGIEQACLIISSYDKNILNEIWFKLSSMHIKCPKPRIGHSKGYISKTKKLPYKKDYWVLNIHSKMSLFLLLSAISCFLKHEQKLLDLQEALNNINIRNENFGNLRMEMIKNENWKSVL